MTRDPSTPRLEPIADDVWAYVQPDGGWMINNMGIVARGDDVTSIDTTSTEARMRAYLAAVDATVGRPIGRIVFTHAHPDHCNGASLVAGAEIVAHRTVAEELAVPHRLAPHIFTPFEQGDTHSRVPSIVFDEGVTIAPGERQIEVRHPGVVSHTRGDAYAWLPAERVLFTGDLVFNGGTPFALSGSISGWLRTLDELEALQPRLVVPGHGPVGDASLFAPVRAYLQFVDAVAADAEQRGLAPLEAAHGLDLGEFGAWPERERIVGNLHRALAERRGGEVDVPQAWQDMFEYNGGRPLDCHA